jgi:membrane protein YdbS with pleckstrin-like domain
MINEELNMKVKRYKPLIDKYFWIIWIPLSILLLITTIISFSEIVALIIMIITDIFTYYFMISSLVSYVELRKDTLYIKYGFILKREIPYNKIRGIEKERRVITYSMLSIKNALEHINIKYNKYDMTTISVVGNDELIEELNKRISKEK